MGGQALIDTVGRKLAARTSRQREASAAWDEFDDAPREIDRIDLGAATAPRARDVIEVPPSARRGEVEPRSIMDTSPPVRAAPPARMLRADGWQPYSARIGDKYYSYQRLDPFASTIGIAADLADLQTHMTDKQRNETAGLLVAATLKNLSGKTWLSGLTDVIEAVNEPERFGQAWLARMASTMAVPAGVAQIARTTDPVLRDARTTMERIRARIPGASSSLLPKRDVLGRELTSEGGLGPNIVSPIWESTRRNDPTINALLDAGISISKPSRSTGDPQNPGKRIELKGEQYDSYQYLTGETARPELDALVRSPGWKEIGFEDRDAAVDRIMRRAREDARSKLMLGEGVQPAPKAQPPGVAGLPDPWMEFGDVR